MKIRINPPFRLLYDLRWMELGKAGGVEQATYELVAAISRLDRKNSYGILAPRSACWEWDFPPAFNVRRLYSDPDEPLGQSFHTYVANRRGASGGDRNFVADRAEDCRFDLVHSTCSYIHPELIDFTGVLTIQDLQHLHHPEFFSKADWNDRERLYRESANRARHVICSSEFTRIDVHEKYGVPLDRVTTIWNIPSNQVWRDLPLRRRRKLLDRMGITGRFLLYPAHCWPHKNHANLLQAMRLAAADLPRDLTLVLTGAPFAVDHPAALLLREPSIGARVKHVGYRSPLEIRALFQECMALVFPSLFEGFGMPVAEALITGLPVACSNVTSLPEIGGDAVVYFDPRDVDDIARRIVQVSTKAELRASLSEAARRRRLLFSSSNSALRTLAVYEQVFAEWAEDRQ